MPGSLAPSTLTAGGHKRAASVADTWPVATNVQNSQLLAYMIAIPDAKAVVDRIRTMRSGTSLHLPSQVSCLDLWQVLAGQVLQQRVWTFGAQLPAAPAPAAAGPAADSQQDEDGYVLEAATAAAAFTSTQQQRTGHGVGIGSTSSNTTLEEATKVGCISSRRPVSVRDGVMFSCIASGSGHSAAAADGGWIYTWGNNDKGQLGCGWKAKPALCHELPEQHHSNNRLANVNLRSNSAGCSSSSSGGGDKAAPGAAAASSSGSRAMHKKDSFDVLTTAVRLPPELQQQLAKEHQQQVADRQQHKLEEEARQAQQQQQHLEQKLAVNTKRTAARLLGKDGEVDAIGISSSQQLQVYRLCVGQAVHMLACGGKHTLAALMGGGLLAWGDNTWGQLGAPVEMYPQAASPMRIHAFDTGVLTHISAGSRHSAAVQDCGTVCCWGSGKYGRLGVGSEPDTLPPTTVPALRGVTVVQVACGSAHTLALTLDGRVYGWGYNGQLAVAPAGAGDAVLAPIQVPGLHPCAAVAAGAASMALSTSGEVYHWGGRASRRAAHAQNSSSGGERPSSRASTAGGTFADTVPWLKGQQVTQISCGITCAAACTVDKQLQLWGDPTSMPVTTWAGGFAAMYDSGLRDQQPQQQQQQQSAEEDDRPVRLRLCVKGHWQYVQVAIDVVQPKQQGQQAASKLDKQEQQQQQRKQGVTDHVRAGQTDSKLSKPSAGSAETASLHGTVNRGQHLQAVGSGPANGGFDPNTEHVQLLSAGGDHAVVLCEPTQYMPTPDEVRQAVLSVLSAYICYWSSTSTTLPLATLETGMSGALGVASLGPYSMLNGPSATAAPSFARAKGTSMSEFASTAAPAGSAGIHTGGAVGTHARSLQSPVELLAGAGSDAEHGSPAKRSRQALTVNWSEQPDSWEALRSLKEEQGSNERSRHAAAGEGSIATSSRVGGSSTRRPASLSRTAASRTSISVKRCSSIMPAGFSAAAAASPAAVPDLLTADLDDQTRAEIDLHGVVLLCREAGLVDNLTEYMDIRRIFELMLHRKRGRLGPAPQQGLAAGPVATNAANTTPGSPRVAATLAVPADLGRPSAAAADGSGGAGTDSAAVQEQVGGSCGPNSKMMMVHVVRPGAPSRSSSPAPDNTGSALGATVNNMLGSLSPTSPNRALTASPAGGSTVLLSGTTSMGTTAGPLVATGRGADATAVLNSTAVPGSTAAAANMHGLHVTSLNQEELLEMLLMVVKERHPSQRGAQDQLLRLLAGKYLVRLKQRKPDKGPPWLLQQMLQPDILQLLEAPTTSELLHRCYVYLAGSHANVEDLRISQADLRLGLRQAALTSIDPAVANVSAASRPLHKQTPSFRHATGRLRRSSSNGGGGGSLAQGSSASFFCSSTGATDGSAFSAAEEALFHVPLGRVAAFLRQAGLVPRLLQKYITQLQRLAEEMDGSAYKTRGVPVMPSLKATVPLMGSGMLLGGVAGNGGNRRFRHGHTGDSWASAATAASCRPSISRAAASPGAASPLPPSPFMSSPADAFSAPAPRHMRAYSMDGCEPGPVCAEPVLSRLSGAGGQRLAAGGARPISTGGGRSVSSGGRPCSTGGAAAHDTGSTTGGLAAVSEAGRTRRASCDGLPRRASQDLGSLSSAGAVGALQQRVTGRRGVQGPTVSEGGAINAMLLDNVELFPLKSRRASIVLDTELPVAASDSDSKAPALMLQLPSPSARLLIKEPDVQCTGGDVAGAAGKLPPANKAKSLPRVAATKPGQAKKRPGLTYEEQQAVLKQQEAAAAEQARLAQEADNLRADTWLVFVLVELLGSYLITPSWEATTTPSTTSLTSGSTDPTDVAYGTGQPLTLQQPQASTAKYKLLSGQVSGTSVDFMSAAVSYPQFVEVLLVMIGARSTGLLAPAVGKSLPALQMDVEIQDHASKVLAGVTKWRSKILGLSGLAQLGAGAAGAATTGAAATAPLTVAASLPSANATIRGTGAEQAQMGPGKGPMTGRQAACEAAVAKVYGLYCTMDAKATYFGLTLQGMLQMCRDTQLLDESLTSAVVTSIFRELLDPESPLTLMNQRRHPPSSSMAAAAAASGSATPRGGAAAGAVVALLQPTSPGVAGEELDWSSGGATRSLAQRQSTFMRRVAEQRMRELGVPVEDPQWQLPGSPTAAQQSSSLPQSPLGQASQQQSGRPNSGSTSSKLQQPVPCEVLTLHQFKTAVRQVAALRYFRIANKMTAWRLMVENHILPWVDRFHTRYDEYCANLSTPAAASLLNAQGRHLQLLFRAALSSDPLPVPPKSPRVNSGNRGGRGTSSRPNSGAPGRRGPKLSLHGFLTLLQDRAALPQLVQPADVAEVLKRLDSSKRSLVEVLTSLSFAEFVQVLAMTGLAAFASRQLRSSFLVQPEQRLAAWLAYLGLPTLPGQGFLLSHAAGVLAAAAGVGGAGMERTDKDASAAKAPGNMSPKQQKSSSKAAAPAAAVDPYQEWWAMAFDPAQENIGRDYASSLEYHLVLLQEPLAPPADCPPAVLQLLDAAHNCQQDGTWQEALELYAAAQEAWQDILNTEIAAATTAETAAAAAARGGGGAAAAAAAAGAVGELSAAAQLYFAVVFSSLLLAAGHDAEAWQELVWGVPALQQLHEAGAEAAVWHACAAVVLHHLQQWQGAYEHAVRAYVIRTECASLGQSHLDTAAAAHNLGCVLDALGKSSRSQQLLTRAFEVLRQQLGPHHPRTLIAARNLDHVKHKAIKLPIQKQQQSEQLPPGTAGSSESASRAAGRTSPTRFDRTAAGTSLASGQSMKDRLQAVVASRQRPAQQGSSSQTPTQRGKAGKLPTGPQPAAGAAAKAAAARVKDYTDLDYLGGGMHQAANDIRVVYERCRPDIVAHATGVCLGSLVAGEQVVELQVSDVVGRSPSPDRELLRGDLASDVTIKAIQRPLTHQQQITLRRSRAAGLLDMGGRGLRAADAAAADQGHDLLGKLFG